MPGETRQKILEATPRLLQMKGLARVTTKEIARETGLSEGALYRHFEHKEEVLFAVLTNHLPTFLEILHSSHGCKRNVSRMRNGGRPCRLTQNTGIAPTAARSSLWIHRELRAKPEKPQFSHWVKIGHGEPLVRECERPWQTTSGAKRVLQALQ